jgi:hypothetical protein
MLWNLQGGERGGEWRACCKAAWEKLRKFNCCGIV